MQPKSFLQVLFSLLRKGSPYWLIVLVAQLIVEAFRSPILELLMSLSIVYIGLGGWIVFAHLKTPLVQSEGFGLGAAAKNLYRAAWWPWYAQREIRRNNR
jgi:hypothetical protein